MCAKFLKIENYPLALVGNMEEMPVLFAIVPNKSFAKEGSKSVTVKTSCCEEKTFTINDHLLW